MIRILATLLIVMMPLMGWAAGGGQNGFHLQGDLYYSATSSDDGTTKSTSDEMDIIPTVGYVFADWVFVGLTYDMLKGNSTSGSTTTTVTYTDYGPTLGYRGDNFFALFTYLFSASREQVATGSETRVLTGTGMGFKFGYGFDVASGFQIGPELLYRSYEFTKEKVGGVETTLAASRKITVLQPFLFLSYKF